ncbi:MAG: hypothetical protein HRT54_06635 [Colwellia sp.]|nr:hypothetical protein [Colwellia sp.]
MNYFKEIDIFPDGWIFLLGGNNNVRQYWIDENRIDTKILEKWAAIYKKRLDFFKKEGITYLSTFAPEKLSIYPNKTPFTINDRFIPSIQLRNYLRNYFDVDDIIINLIPYLRKQSETFQTYHKTDSHWNFYGAFSAYQLLQAHLGEPVYTEALSRPKKYAWGVLDLGGKLIPPLKEKIFYYSSSDRFKRTFANELVEFKERENRTNDAGLHVGSYVIFENDDSLSDKKVMIFGDSFSEYRDHLLTGLFAETYKEVHFIWNSSVDFDLIRKVKPDIVISEMAERFIPKISNEYT